MPRLAAMQNAINVEDSLVGSVDRLAELGYDSLQFKAGGLADHSPADLRAALADAGLAVPPCHADLETLEADLPAAVEPYRAVGCDDLVVCATDDAFASVGSVERLAERLGVLADRLDDRGVGLAYHLHGAEFATLDGQTGLDRLLDGAPGVAVEPDVPWVATGGGEPVELFRDLAGRVPVAHVADVDRSTGEKVPLGEGDLDIEAVVETAGETGVEWLVYEYGAATGYEPLAEMAARVA